MQRLCPIRPSSHGLFIALNFNVDQQLVAGETNDLIVHEKRRTSFAADITFFHTYLPHYANQSGRPGLAIFLSDERDLGGQL
jgi:hypothetical protein